MSATLQCDYCHLPIAGARQRGQAEEEPAFCCYGCRLAARITQARGEAGHVNWMLTRLGTAAFLTMGVMVFAMYLYGQDVYRQEGATPSPLEVSLAGVMRYLALFFATPVFVLLGVPILGNAVEQLRRGVASTDALVVLGVAAAFGYSYVSTLTGAGHTYYETACMVLVLLTFGRWLEASSKLKASEAVTRLESLLPDEVQVRRDGQTLTIPTGDVVAGDALIVRAGERLAADGVIEQGEAHVDEQMLSGESAPTVRGEGDVVRAGSIALDGTLTVRVTAVGGRSAIGRLAALLAAARLSKGRYERLTDRVAAVFVPLTIVLAGVAAALGFRRAGAEEALLSSLAVMLIACPCALGIATPMAVWVSLGRAASQGVLFRSAEMIERLAGLRAVAFDKTGTLTTGTPIVRSIDANGGDPARVLGIAAGLAAHSTHVLSRGIASRAEADGVACVDVPATQTVPGCGVIAEQAGSRVSLGSVALMARRGHVLSDGLQRAVDRLCDEGCGVACLGVDERVVGVFGFSETLRPEARAAIDALKCQGLQVVVLTGDHTQRARAVAEVLGVETFGALSPEGKLDHLGRLRRDAGPVGMVGDGLNDAPALAAADVGIAMRCGADITRESADVCLLGDDLATLPKMIRLARRTVHTIRLNLFWAFAYNAAGISLAMVGRLSPIAAAGAMVLSSVFVATNSLRLRRVSLALDARRDAVAAGRGAPVARHGLEAA